MRSRSPSWPASTRPVASRRSSRRRTSISFRVSASSPASEFGSASGTGGLGSVRSTLARQGGQALHRADDSAEQEQVEHDHEDERHRQHHSLLVDPVGGRVARNQHHDRHHDRHQEQNRVHRGDAMQERQVSAAHHAPAPSPTHAADIVCTARRARPVTDGGQARLPRMPSPHFTNLLIVAVVALLAPPPGSDPQADRTRVRRLVPHRDRARPQFRLKLEAVGFGVFIPVFFVTSGVRFDLHALWQRLYAGAGASVPAGDLPRARPARDRLQASARALARCLC